MIGTNTIHSLFKMMNDNSTTNTDPNHPHPHPQPHERLSSLAHHNTMAGSALSGAGASSSALENQKLVTTTKLREESIDFMLSKQQPAHHSHPNDNDNHDVDHDHHHETNLLIPEQVKQADVDALLANELNQMSIQEREEVYEEIHGVSATRMETPELVEQSLWKMDQALQNIPVEQKRAYLMAEQQNKDYVTSSKFRIMFLRCEQFQDAQKAAEKLCAYLEGKLTWFGPDTLTRSVYLTDLDKDDLACLKSGCYQLLPSRDSVGRSIIADFHLILPKCYKRPENLLKTLAYLQLANIEDEETQKRGIVGVVYYVGQFTGKFNHSLNKQIANIVKWIPFRLTGYHICFDDPRIRAWKPLAMLLMGKALRIRVRIHDGTHTECRYSLMTFGVPVDVLPITYQGEVKTVNHTKWIARRKVKEDSLRKKGYFEGIDLPGRNDVLLRRGRIFHDHPGNLRMRTLIDAVQEEYTIAPMKEKAAIAARIVRTIQEEGGRFLEHDNDSGGGWWVIVSDKEAGKRVSKSIRTMRTSVKKSTNTTTTTTTTSDIQENDYQDNDESTRNTITITAGNNDTSTQPSLFIRRTEAKRARINNDTTSSDLGIPCFALPCLGGGGDENYTNLAFSRNMFPNALFNTDDSNTRGGTNLSYFYRDGSSL